jgi:Mor family transcriptional regulator
VKSIPLGDSPEERERRDELYSQFDVNGNNYLSLA